MKLTTASEAMQRAVRDGVFPGAVLAIRVADQAPEFRAFGRQSVEPHAAAMTTDVVFDVSSLTKAFVTSIAVMQLVEDARLSLDNPVAQHLPQFRETEKSGVTIRHLLCHASGLPAWRDFHPDIATPSPTTRSLILDAVARTPLDGPPGTRAVYSDLGFLLLGDIVERLCGRRLDAYADARIFAPLELHATGFVDLTATQRRQFPFPVAPTEHDPRTGTFLCGVVHDDNARAMGGIAGHAGLFSCARDLDLLLHHLHGLWSGRKTAGIVSAGVLRTFWSRAALPPDSTWCLGWDTPSPQGSSAGRLLSRHAVGHLGFTGVSAWLDLDRGVQVLLLTNRVHPTRANERIRAFRPELHDRVYQDLFGT